MGKNFKSMIQHEQTTVIKSGKDGNPRNRLLIITPTLGVVRMEWAMARYGQPMPCNWAASGASLGMGFTVPMHYLVADAQNLGAEDCLKKGFDWCFLGDTLIETADGAKPIRAVLKGELVKTHTGKYKEVVKTMRRPIKSGMPLIWVRTDNNTIKCTPEHPFYIKRDGEKRFVSAEKLKTTDFLLYPSVLKTDNLPINIICSVRGIGYNNSLGSKKYGGYIGKLTVDKELARFLGLYLAEGHASKDYIGLTFGNGEKEYIDFVKLIIKKKFKRKPSVNTAWATQVRLHIRSLSARFREWFGHKAANKRVPSFVYEWNLQNRLAFLKGYFDGDGSYQQNACSFSSANIELIKDIIRLGKTCGLSFSKIYSYKQSPIAGYLRKDSQIHQGRIDVQSFNKMMDLIGAIQIEGYLKTSIKDVENHNVSGGLVDSAVYNLEVRDDNSYIANGAAVHNCLFWEDDVVAPPDAMLQLNKYIISEEIPVVSGLYFLKGTYSEPILYKGLGNGPYLDFQIGDKVWVDGVPTGFLLIHSKVLKLMWDESEVYETLGKRKTRKIFETPAKIIYDPETNSHSTATGTSDLVWCHRVIDEKVLTRAGWPKIGRKKYPFLCDTRIFCRHIELATGRQYP